MLSDVTLQFHISYFCQDNDGGKHCQGMISDNSRHLGELEEIYGKALVFWGRWERVKSAPFLCIVTSQVTVNFTSVSVGNWRHLHILTNCRLYKYLLVLSSLYSSSAHKHTSLSQTQKYLPTANWHTVLWYTRALSRYAIMLSCWEYRWSPFNVLMEKVFSRSQWFNISHMVPQLGPFYLASPSNDLVMEDWLTKEFCKVHKRWKTSLVNPPTCSIYRLRKNASKWDVHWACCHGKCILSQNSLLGVGFWIVLLCYQFGNE